MRDDTRNVIDDNISTQVQSKVKLQEYSIDTSIEIDQQDLEILRTLLQKLIIKRNEIMNNHTQEDESLVTDKLVEVIGKIDKVQNNIHTLKKRLETIDFEEGQHMLHERNDSTGTHYLFDTFTSKNRKYYPKDWIFKHKMNKIGDIPVFLNNFQQFIEKYEFDNVFDQQIQNIDPRENDILCKIIKEGFDESPDIMNINTVDIFRIIRDLKRKYTSLFGRDRRLKAWEKVLVDTTCKNTELLISELQKLILMEKWILSKCCQDCPNLTQILEEAILGTLHESVRNPVKQRLHVYSISENEKTEEILINIVIETVMDLSPPDSHYTETNCKYCKSEFHSSVNCRKKVNKKLRYSTTSCSKGNYSQGTTKKNTPKLVQNQSEPLRRQQKKNSEKGSNKNVAIIDTGSGVNITNNKELLHNYKDNKENIQFFGIGKNNSVSVKGSGYIKIKGNTDDDYLLAHYVPEEETTIISGYELAKETDLVLSRNYFTLGNRDMNIKTQVKNGIIYVKIDDIIDHPAYDVIRSATQPNSSPKTKCLSLNDAHKRMGHTGVQQIENSIKHGHYEESIDLIREPNEFWCETCKVSKATRRNHYAGSIKEHSIDHEPGSSWCMDIFGPVTNSNSDAKRYMFIMVHNNTKYCITSTHFNKNAETVLAQIKKNIQYVETQFDRKVREINSDQRTEFTNDQIAKYFVSKGVRHILSVTYDQAANGVAERYTRTIITDAITLLRHSNLRFKFWEYAVTSATDLRNCLENKNTGQLPLKAISSQPVKVRFMSFLPFGEQGVVWDHNHKKPKQRGLTAILLCKDPNSQGYKFFVPSIKKVLTSSNYTLSNNVVDPLLRNTQGIYLNDRKRLDKTKEAENINAVSKLYDALEDYEDDRKPVTLLTDLFTAEELAQIEANAKYPSPSDNLDGNLDYVFS